MAEGYRWTTLGHSGCAVVSIFCPKREGEVLSIITVNKDTAFVTACLSILERVDCDDTMHYLFIFQNGLTVTLFLFSQLCKYNQIFTHLPHFGLRFSAPALISDVTSLSLWVFEGSCLIRERQICCCVHF